MNQILVTKKLYVTPELKRKKRRYKIHFLVSVFLIIALVSFYIYAEYDRTKEEQVAQDILTSLVVEEDPNSEDDDAMVVLLGDATESDAEVAKQEAKKNKNKNKTNKSNANKRKTVHTEDGTEYTSVATVTIPAISVKYPVLLPEAQTSEAIEEILKVAPCKFWGPEVNEVGNYCIVGHNYRNKKFFSKVPTLSNGDIIELTGVDGTTVKYSVYDKYSVVPTDVSCTSQLTNGRREITLITCTDDSSQRVIVRAKEVK